MATTRTRSTGTTKRSPARRRAAAPTTPSVSKAVNSARTRAKRVAKAIPTDTRSLTIAGIIAGAIGAGIALFLGRDRVRSAASTGSEKIKQVADDLSTLAHEKLDLARDNITKFRSRDTQPAPSDETLAQPYSATN